MSVACGRHLLPKDRRIEQDWKINCAKDAGKLRPETTSLAGGIKHGG